MPVADAYKSKSRIGRNEKQVQNAAHKKTEPRLSRFGNSVLTLITAIAPIKAQVVCTLPVFRLSFLSKDQMRLYACLSSLHIVMHMIAVQSQHSGFDGSTIPRGIVSDNLPSACCFGTDQSFRFPEYVCLLATRSLLDSYFGRFKELRTCYELR